LTKRRPPLSIDAALARIAGQLENGWAEMGKVVNRSESMVRAWGDADRRENMRMPIDAAITLDLAYRGAGGDGAPIFEAYAHQLEAEGGAWFADQIALGRYAAEIIRECGEAGSAVVLSCQPGASVSQRREALREVEEAIGVLTRARMMLGTPSPFTDRAELAHPSTAPPPSGCAAEGEAPLPPPQRK
jgi:hypothetical protein